MCSLHNLCVEGVNAISTSSQRTCASLTPGLMLLTKLLTATTLILPLRCTSIAVNRSSPNVMMYLCFKHSGHQVAFQRKDMQHEDGMQQSNSDVMHTSVQQKSPGRSHLLIRSSSLHNSSRNRIRGSL